MMNILQRLASSFAVASYASAASYPADAQEHAAFDAPAVRYMTDVDGEFVCNFSYVGPNVALTASHCLEQDNLPQDLREMKGPPRAVRHLYIPDEQAAAQIDRHADPRITEDMLHWGAGQDKAILHLDARTDTAPNSVMRLAPLDALPWRTPSPSATHQVADVFIIGYWPDTQGQGNHTLHKYPCRLFRLPHVDEMLIHDCPEAPGVSASPIVMENAPGDYSIVAIHSGYGILMPGETMETDFLGTTIQTILQSVEYKLASGIWSVRRACDTLPCTVQYDARGHASLHFAPVP